jgi:hypothetical protein
MTFSTRLSSEKHLVEIIMDTQSSEFVVGWGTLMLINAGLAQSKGRGGLNWFLLSIFLGPIATFFIVISEPLVSSQSDKEKGGS